jgi:predicted nuclease of predicted toxin-antitoxin system
VKFLIDRCAGRRLADWLRAQGHDVVESRTLGPDPGDLTLLRWATDDGRILVTIDTDFGALLHIRSAAHAGLIRLPDVPAQARIALIAQVLRDHTAAELSQSVVTVRGHRIRISRPPFRSG